MADNPFAKYAQQVPVYGPPPVQQPVSQTDQHRLQNDDARLQLARNADQRAQNQADLAKQKSNNLKSDTVDSVKSVLDQIDSVEKDVKDSWFNGTGETGWTGWMMRSLPGSAAYDLQRKIDMIDANTAFDRLQQMRQNSPTGGAVGNVSDNDLRLLKSTIASLDPNQSQESFLAALHKARLTYQHTLSTLTGQTTPAPAADAKSSGGWGKAQVVGN